MSAPFSASQSSAPVAQSAAVGTAQLVLEGVTKRYPERLLLDEVSLTVRPGERVGVIGENGSGKSTLLRMLAGVEEVSNGAVTVVAPGGVGYLVQRLDAPRGRTVRAVVDLAFAELRALERQLRQTELSLAEYSDSTRLNAYGELLATYEHRGGYQVDSRVDAALHGLGVPHLDRDRELRTLSGGERTRLALAATLAADPELLLLDEPTNDLDDQALDWLEARLARHRGTVVVVTHDRGFLERVTSTILEVDPDRHTVRRYGDGYQGYLRAKAVARARWEREYADWLAEVERQRRLAERGATMLASISRKGPSGFSGHGRHHARSSSSATSGRVRNARERLRRLYDEELVPRPPQPLRFSAELGTYEEREKPARALVELRGVDVSGGRLRVPELRLDAGERCLVTGPNGAGKSTLLELLARQLAPERVGLLRQDSSVDQPRRTVLEAYAAGRPGSAEEYAERLRALGLFRPAELDALVGELSAGQLRRLELARLVSRPVDLLLLDEPTNHLSPLLVEELEQALADYQGTLVLVTHDRRLRTSFTGSHLQVSDGRVHPKEPEDRE